MNVLDSELVGDKLREDGYVFTDKPEEADVILVNTCSVREHAEDRAISNAGIFCQRKKKNPSLIIGVIGCMAQNYQDKLFKRLPEIDLVVGPRKLGAIPRLLKDIENSRKKIVACEDHDDEFIEPTTRRNNFQAYIKVSEGCDMSCTFCIVPTTRGPEVSRKTDDILNEVKLLADNGTREITFLGQTVNSYRYENARLSTLLEKASEINGISRIRFITSHPLFVTDDLISAMTLPQVCKYLHIPAQSGSDRILKLMKRGYTFSRYTDMVQKLRSRIPEIGLASDFIVGFPTETDEDFVKTSELMDQVRFQNSYVFKYSPRPHTKAIEELADDVPIEKKKERNQKLLEIQATHSLENNKKLVGKTAEILVEGPSKNDKEKQAGRTDSNQIVVFKAGRDMKGQLVNVRITEATSLTLFGDLV